MSGVEAEVSAMAKRGGFHIAGLSALKSAFGNLNPANNAEKGVKEAGELLRGDIAARAPYDTGHLSRSYGVKMESRGNTAIAHVGTNVEYAIHQEYGTVYQGGTPHVRPALDANRSKFLDMMGKQALHATFDQIR